MITLKVTKTQRFILSLKNTVPDKPLGGRNVKFPRSLFGVKFFFTLWIIVNYDFDCEIWVIKANFLKTGYL